jgi:N-acetylmuramic acid 6-phosphate etherase
MEELPLTEAVNPSSADLDLLDTHELLHRINDEDRKAAWAVERELDVIGTAVDAIAQRLAAGGTLHYFGTGTSGRLGVLDAAEIGPTFSAGEMVVAHIAGGGAAVAGAVEGAEDDAAAGAAELGAAGIGAKDAVIGLSASGAAPYVLGALRAARDAGALTICVTNSERTPLESAVQIPIVLRTGAEVLAGSTRMKAASAQKMALHTISTAVMVKLGRVHGNLMVDVTAANAKLRTRALRITMALAAATKEDAAAALAESGDRVKEAVVMLRRNCDVVAARVLLASHGGNLRRALATKM